MYDSAARNIARYGTAITLNIHTKGAIDFSTGQASDTIVAHSMLAVLGNYRSSEIVEGVINIDDMKCTLQFNGAISKSDTVIAGTTIYQVINVSHLIRSGSAIKTTLQLRS